MGFGIKNIQSGLAAASKVGSSSSNTSSARNSNFQPPFHSDDNNSFVQAAISTVNKVRGMGRINPSKQVDSPIPSYFPKSGAGGGNA